MPNVIRMTAAQAASVAGMSPISNAAIVPVATTDPNTFYLGLEVIGWPAFADRQALLQSFPQVDYATVIVPLLLKGPP